MISDPTCLLGLVNAKYDVKLCYPSQVKARGMQLSAASQNCHLQPWNHGLLMVKETETHSSPTNTWFVVAQFQHLQQIVFSWRSLWQLLLSKWNSKRKAIDGFFIASCDVDWLLLHIWKCHVISQLAIKYYELDFFWSTFHNILLLFLKQELVFWWTIKSRVTYELKPCHYVIRLKFNEVLRVYILSRSLLSTNVFRWQRGILAIWQKILEKMC